MESDMNGTPVSPEEDEGRPPVDPYNKLYTVLSLLIFAAGYCGVKFLSGEFFSAYSFYCASPSESCRVIVMRETGLEALPEGASIDYFRLNDGFDGNALYISLLLPEDMDREEAEEFIPFEHGDPYTDLRLEIYPDEDMVPDYAYGDNYISLDDPGKSCFIYEREEGLCARFRTVNYDKNVSLAMKEGAKIKVEEFRREGSARGEAPFEKYFMGN